MKADVPQSGVHRRALICTFGLLPALLGHFPSGSAQMGVDRGINRKAPFARVCVVAAALATQELATSRRQSRRLALSS